MRRRCESTLIFLSPLLSEQCLPWDDAVPSQQPTTLFDDAGMEDQDIPDRRDKSMSSEQPEPEGIEVTQARFDVSDNHCTGVSRRPSQPAGSVSDRHVTRFNQRQSRRHHTGHWLTPRAGIVRGGNRIDLGFHTEPGSDALSPSSHLHALGSQKFVTRLATNQRSAITRRRTFPTLQPTLAIAE